MVGVAENRRAFVGVLAAAGLLFVAAPAAADTYRATRTGDAFGECKPSNCTLREAIMAANATPRSDRVVVPKGHYRLSVVSPDGLVGCLGDAEFGDLGLCPEGGKVTLAGAGAKRTIIDARGINRVLTVVGDGAPGGPVATIKGVTLTGGRATSGDEGGGLAVDFGRELTLTRSIVRGNRTTTPAVPGNGGDGGGIINLGGLRITKSTIRGNSTSDGGDGGGLASGGTLVMRSSTISANRARGTNNDGDAGGLLNTGTATIVNSTISGNHAAAVMSSDGGGIYSDGDIQIRSSTIAYNDAQYGGGIEAVERPENTQTIRNSIVAANRDHDPGATGNCEQAPTSLGFNLEPGATCGFTESRDSHGKAKLAKLRSNGGPTLTHALRKGSAAINHGAPQTPGSAGGCPKTDQRGVGRRKGGRCDIGAYERKRRRHHH